MSNDYTDFHAIVLIDQHDSSMTYELLLIGLALLNVLHESEVGTAEFLIQLTETFSSSHHHFHYKERICLVAAQVELLPSTFPDDLRP